MSVESPGYQLVKKADKLELRRYQPYVLATVRVRAAGYDDATNAGFQTLADYIFGNNTAAGSISMTAPVTAERARGERIAMTAPVTSSRERTEQLGDAEALCTVRCPGEYAVSFTMPSRFTSVDMLPQPNNPAVVLEAVPEHLAVVARFGGYLDDAAVAGAVARIDSWLAEEGLVAEGEPIAAQYDAPWKPGFARHNEVLVRVAEPR